MTPMKAIALLSTLQRADIVLPTTDGREIRLRRIPEPTAEEKTLLRQLGISLPEHHQFHRKCSADSAIARTYFQWLRQALAGLVTNLGLTWTIGEGAIATQTNPGDWWRGIFRKPFV